MHMCVFEYMYVYIYTHIYIVYIYQDVKSLEYYLYLLLIVILMHSQGLSIRLWNKFVPPFIFYIKFYWHITIAIIYILLIDAFSLQPQS